MSVHEQIGEALEDGGEHATDLVPHGLARLQRAPVINSIDEKTLALISSQIAPGCNRGEVGHFLELCAHYDLDPFAKEAWCAKNKGGDKLLIMVGRDGLRKIAHRQGLHVDGDVVREKDEYAVTFVEYDAETTSGEWNANGCRPFHRVTHKWQGIGKQRGEVVGAWARVRDASGREAGWFEAPIEEYRPANVSQYSPWSKQVGVMMLAAAERQSIRQATPLGGLMAIGEDEVVFDHEAAIEEATEVVGAPIDEHEVERIGLMLAEVGWTDDEVRMHLTAVGAADISNIGAAITALTWEQAAELTSAINAALDARDVAEANTEAKP